MVTYHYIDAIITFMLLCLSMITGALTIMIKDPRKKKTVMIIHVLISIVAFIAFVITFIRAPRL